MKIINKRLARSKTLKFLYFLQARYPIRNLTVRFQKEPVLTLRSPNGKPDAYLYGKSYGSEITISTMERDPTRQLHLAAHEYFHVMQFNDGTASEDCVITFADGSSIQVDEGDETKADEFAANAISAFSGESGR